MRTLYGKPAHAPLCALLLALAGCGSTATSGGVDQELAALGTWTPQDAPEHTAQALVEAWNAGARADVLPLFAPDRRRVVAAAPELDARLADWRAVSATVPLQCNPRGAYFKTAVITYEDRRSGAPIEEIVWLHLKNGGWWMYSL